MSDTYFLNAVKVLLALLPDRRLMGAAAIGELGLLSASSGPTQCN